MGTSVVNFHVKGDDVAAVDAVLIELGPSRRTEPEAGWITVYEERASTQDPEWVAAVALRLSHGTGAPAIAFLLHDSDVAMVWLADDGEIVARLDSDPGYPESDREPLIEGAARLTALALDLDESGVIDLFTRPMVFADDRINGLATALGIRTARALSDYRDGDEPPTFDPADDLAALIERSMPPGVEAASDEEVALVEAADTGDLTRLGQLLDQGLSVDGLVPWRDEAARSGPAASRIPAIAATALYAAAAADRPEAIAMLIARGADPDAAIPSGSTPLAVAACTGNVEAVQALLASGADPHNRAGSGMSAGEALDATRTQFEAIRSMMSTEAAPELFGYPLPADADLAACAEVLREAG